MANQRIDQLNAETAPAAADVLPIFSIAGADTKKITVKNLVQQGAALIDDGSIPGSKVNLTTFLNGTIVNADINASAEIAVSKLADGAARQLLQTDAAGTGVEWASNIDIPGTLDVTSAATFDSTVAITGTLTQGGNNVVTVGDTGTVTSTMLLNGTIVDADVNASAAIAYSKLASLSSGNIVIGSSVGVATSTAVTGDVTISDTGVTSIGSGVIVNADINASAAIADTKLDTIATAGKVSNSSTTATNLNTASAIVARDASGNFTAGTITAALTGTASGNLVSGGALGTPSSGTLTSCTDLPISTGVSGLGTGAATFLATPSSANLAALLTDETGTGANVFATSPTLVSPALGTPSSGILTNCTNLPVATASVAGAVSIPAAGGLALAGSGAVSHSNSVTAGTTSGITFDAQGHITATTALTGANLPAATSGVIGGVRPGTGLTVDGSGIINISAATNADLGGVIAGSDFGISTGTISLATQGGLVAGTYTKATFNSKGIATGGSTLTAADIPNLAATQITSGSLDIARIGANTVTGAKVANYAVTKIGDTQPTADYIGQFFFNPLSRDLALWDGNVFQPIGISVGEIVFAGTFDASAGSGTGHVASVTAEGTAIGLVEGSPLPAAATANNRYYLVVSESGTITSGNAPQVALAPPDIVLSTGIEWTEVDVSQTFTSVSAAQVAFTPEGTIGATNVQAAIEEVNNEKLGLAGGTVTGNLEIGTAGSLSFEGSTANAFELSLAVVDPTADRTITLPDTTGTVVTTGDTGSVTSTMLLNGTIVDADVNASAAIAYSKLATLTSGNIVLGSSANIATSTSVTGDVTISNLGVTAIASGVIVNDDINASAGIVDTKLATIATAGKVSNSSTTATNLNTASAIVARDASGNFTAGTITAALTGTASGNLVSGGALGTPASGTLTSCTGLPISGLTASTSTALGVGSIELGDASDTTLSRSAAGVLAVEGVVIPSISSTSTLTNKTLTDPAIIGTILEDVFTITDGAAFEVDPGNGSIQLITLGASRTPKCTNFVAGESITLMVNDGTAYTITWTDATWGTGGVIWKGGTAPTLATTGYSVIQFWKVSTQVYGASVGNVA
jgi:hypothetical protein